MVCRGLMLVVTYEQEESMVLFVVGMGGERMILDMGRPVVKCEVFSEVVEKVDWSADD